MVPHRSLLATGADKAKEAAGDAQASPDAGAPKGYVAAARDAAANALQQVEGYVVHRLAPGNGQLFPDLFYSNSLIATGQKKVDETSGNDVKASVNSAVDQTKAAASVR